MPQSEQAQKRAPCAPLPADDHRGDRRPAAGRAGAVADRHERVGVEPRGKAGEMNLQRRGDKDVLGQRLDRDRVGEHGAHHGVALGGIGGLDAARARRAPPPASSMAAASASSRSSVASKAASAREAAAVERRHAEFARARAARPASGSSGSGRPSCTRCWTSLRPARKRR